MALFFVEYLGTSESRGMTDMTRANVPSPNPLDPRADDSVSLHPYHFHAQQSCLAWDWVKISGKKTLTTAPAHGKHMQVFQSGCK